jgi:phage-related protein
VSEDASAGRLYVDVVADTTGFARDAQAKVDAEASRVRARIKADIDLNARELRDKVSLAAREAQAKVKVQAELDGAQIRAEIAALGKTSGFPKVHVTAELDKARASTEMQAFLAEARKDIRVGVDADTTRARLSIDALRVWAAAHNISINIDTKSIDKVSSTLRGFGTTVLGLTKFPAIAAGISLAAGALTQVAGGLFAVVSAASPAVGVLAAIPNLLGVAAQGLGSLILGFDGVGSALKAVQTVQQSQGQSATVQAAANQKLAAAMDKLSPAAKQFALVLAHEVIPRFNLLKQAVSTSLLPPLTTAIHGAMPLFDTLQTGLVASGRVMGDLTARALGLASSALFRRDIATVMASNNRAMTSFGFAGLSVMDIMRNLAVTAGPMVERFARFVLSAADRVRDLVQQGRDTGRLEAFFHRAGDTAAQLVRIIRNISLAIFNVGRVATPAGQGLLDSFEKATLRLRELTSGPDAQRGMRVFFANSAETLRATGRLINDLGRALGVLGDNGGKSFGPLIDQIRAKLLPAITDTLSQLGQTLGPALIDTITTIVQLIGQLSGAGGGGFTSFVATLGLMARALLAVVRVPGIGPLVASLLSLAGAAAAISLVGGALGGLISPLVQTTRLIRGFADTERALEDGAKGATKAGAALRTYGSAAASTAADLAKSAGAAVRTGAAFLISRGASLAAAAASGIASAATAVWTGAQWLLNAAMDANPIGLVVLAIAALVGAIIFAYTHFEGFRKVVNAVWDAIRTTFVTGIGQIVSFVTTTWGQIIKVVSTVMNAVGSVVSTAWAGLVSVFGPPLQAILGVIRNVFNVISGIFQFGFKVWLAFATLGLRLIQIGFANAVRVWGAIIRGGLSALSAIFRVVFGAVAAVVRGVLFLIRSYIQVEVTIWTTVFRVAWAAVSTIFRVAIGGLVNLVRILWTTVSNAFRIGIGFVTGVVRTGFGLIRTVVAGLFGAVRSVVAGVWSALRSQFGAGVSFVTGVWSGLWNTVRSIATSVFGGVRNAISTVLGGIRGAFSAAVGFISTVWNGLKAAVMAPISFIVNTVYNNGIRKAWNAVAGVVHSSPLPHIDGFARGGVIPGYAPGQDTVPAMLSPGEGILVPEAVRGLGGSRAVHAINAAFSTRVAAPARRTLGRIVGGVQHFDLGGIVSDVGHAIGGAVSGATSFLKNQIRKGLLTLVAPVINLTHDHFTDSGFAGLFARLINQAIARLLEFVGLIDARTEKATAFGGGAFGGRTPGTNAADVVSGGGGRRTFDVGGRLRPGTTVVDNHTGEDEAVLRPTAIRALGGWSAVDALNRGTRLLSSVAASATTSAAAPRGKGDGDDVLALLRVLASRPQIDVHPAPGQSEYEIARIASREIGWQVTGP